MSNNIFYRLLCFIGVRDKKSSEKYTDEHKVTFYNIVKRKLIRRKQENDHAFMFHQPRKITRMLYRRENQIDLSPDPDYREINHSSNIIINREQIEDEKEKSCSKLFCSLMNNWCYTLFIFSLLCVQPIHTLAKIIQMRDLAFDSPVIENKQQLYIASFFFQLIPPVQYYNCIRYFQTDHFESFYFGNKININKIIRVTYIILLLSSLNVVGHLISLQIFSYDNEFPEYFDYPTHSQIIILVFLVCSWTYGNLILFTNFACFCLVFWKHSKQIHKFSQRLQLKDDQKSLNQLTQELTTIVYDLKNSITDFQNIFSNFTFLGAIAFGFFIEEITEGNFNFFPWNTFIVYAVIQIIFFFILVNVSQNRNGMSDYIRNPNHLFRFIRRYTVEELFQHFSRDDEKYILINLIEENANVADWNTLNNIINENWAEFIFFGINIADFELIKRSALIVTLIVMITSYT